MSSLLPTGKAHVSYSEVKNWKECPWKHKLLYIDKLGQDIASPYLDYGTAIHECCESFLKTGVMDPQPAIDAIETAWEAHGFDEEAFVKRRQSEARSQGWTYKHDPVENWIQWAKDTLSEVSGFLDTQFPGWECVSAEEPLYESIKDNEGVTFKGYIDVVLKAKNKRGQVKYWILDWKTASPRGWHRQKKQDFLTLAQIALYKSYWAEKNNIPLKDVKTGFILLKRGTSGSNVCSLFEVSTGPKTLDKANKMVNNMIWGLHKGITLKNRQSCRFCEFKNTPACP